MNARLTSRFLATLILASTVVLGAHVAHALSVSITPPLIQLSIGPGETWSSSIKVVNTNDHTVTYYSSVADFTASGESGHASLTPLVNETRSQAQSTYSLASWINLTSGPVTVPAGSSAQIPFTLHIPKNAEPGGHYAAILIGTQPGATSTPGSHISIASYVSSLLFVTIKGDVVENGRIIEFSTSKELYQSPKADFTLRFENTGNTHVQPQGDVTIYNMWGQERGKVLVNGNNGSFGNVLPGSIRRFQFSWSGDNPFDIGLYRAIVTLAYGQQAKRSASAIAYFWVVPVVPVLIALASLVLLILLIAWLIRRYIRRALSLEQERLELHGSRIQEEEPPSVGHSVGILMEPLREGVVDLRSLAAGGQVSFRGVEDSGSPAEPQPAKTRMTLGAFIRKYRLFALFIAIIVGVVFLGSRYFHGAFGHDQHFRITDIQMGVESATSSSGAGAPSQ